MKTLRIIALALAALALAGLSSCTFLSDVMSTGGLSSLTDRATAEIASATGITGMTQKAMFAVIYSQGFYMGGFNPELYPLAETQGTTWKTVTTSGRDTSTITSERALLKKNADGTSWWYLTWKPSDSEDDFSYEALMDADMMAKKIRYFNKGTSRVEETTFDVAAKEGAENAQPEEGASADVDKDDLGEYHVGKETVTVGAGTFDTDKYSYVVTGDDGKKATYTWWVSATAPGGLVKYSTVTSDSTLTGELVGSKKGYKTRFSSF